MNDQQTDKNFLYRHYQKCRTYVSSSKELCLYADEKFRHSMQVVGAGNYLLKNEKGLQSWTPEQKYLGWLGCLFHDIGHLKKFACAVTIKTCTAPTCANMTMASSAMRY